MLKVNQLKTPSFTLNEILIAMIISVIVIGIAFSVLGLIQKHMWSIQENLKISGELNRFEQALWIDFNTYHDIIYIKQERELRLSNPIDSLIYQLNDNWIVREQDTFELKVSYKSFYFDGKNVTSGRIDAIQIKADTNKVNQSVFVYKRNDAALFMN